MELLQALAELKAIAMERIAQAARRGDAADIRGLAELAAQLDADLRAAREIEARRVRYARELTGARLDWDPPAGFAAPPRAPTPVSQAPRAVPTPPPAPAPPVAAEPPAEVSAEPDPRGAFLVAAAESGVPLAAMTRTLYRTEAGRAVAVPFANEVRPGRWLLSLEDMRYDFVALLCQPADGTLRAFVLPWRVLEPVWKGLSRNGRQVKLSVAKKPDGWWLQVPATDGILLDAYLDGYARLGEAPPAPRPVAPPVSL